MITSSKTHVVRRAARAASTATMVAIVASSGVIASPASANVPEGWSNPAEVDAGQALLVLVGAPVGLFLLIALLVYGPALARGEKLGGNGARGAESEWFGGPRKTTEELAAPDTEASQAGGASGKW